MHGYTQNHLPFSLNCPQLSQQPVLVQNHPGEIILTPEETRRVIKYFLNLDSNQKIQHVSASWSHSSTSWTPKEWLKNECIANQQKCILTITSILHFQFLYTTSHFKWCMAMTTQNWKTPQAFKPKKVSFSKDLLIYFFFWYLLNDNATIHVNLPDTRISTFICNAVPFACLAVS